MDRLKVLTDAEAFKKAFPNKADMVVSKSIVEMLTLYLNIRTDFDCTQLLKLSVNDFHTKVIEWLGDIKVPTTAEETGIVNGCVYYDTDITDKDLESVYNLLKTQTRFQQALFSIHPECVKKFILTESGKLCGDVLLHCSDEEFNGVLNSIDVPFTTVSNLLTAIRSDLLINTTRYGRIRTNKDVFLIDLIQSTEDCIGIYASKL